MTRDKSPVRESRTPGSVGEVPGNRHLYPTADFARRLRQRRPKPGDTWHLDEVYLRINGVLHYLGTTQHRCDEPQSKLAA